MEIALNLAPAALAIIMLGLGLTLTFDDFARVIKKPKDFIVGFTLQVILLPIVAFFLIKILNTSLELAMGVMLIAAAPGGVTSNVLTKYVNGDVALSITLTAIISLFSIFSVPFIIFKSAELLNFSDFNNKVSMLEISLKMFMVVTFPVIIGMIIRKLATELVVKNALLIQKISVFLFAIVFLAIWVEEWNNITNYIMRAGTIALTLNITMMLIGYYFAKYLVSGIKQRKCISLECGLQNGSLALFVGAQIFNDVEYLIPTATYALIMIMTSVIFVLILRKTI